MKTRGKIFQIVKWEEKGRFFWNCDFGGVVVDMLHIGTLKTEKLRWHDRWILGMIKGFFGVDKPIFKYASMALDCCDGLPVLVERPHTFSVGDVVIVDIAVKDGGLFGGVEVDE